MYPVSAAYKEAIKQNVRDVRITGTITLKTSLSSILQMRILSWAACISRSNVFPEKI